MIEVTVAMRAVREAVEALRALGKTGAAARQRALDVKEAKRLLGLVDPAGEAYRSDAVHPLFTPGEIHPDNKAALLAAGTDLLAGDLARRDKLPVDATDNSLLLFGSPTSEGLSRVVFGYSELGDREGLIQDDLHIDLAYAWELDPERLGGGEVARFVPDRGLVTRPPWQIKDLRGGRWNRFTPRADQDGMICEDYLLVTRLPNFLSSEAESRGQFLVNFGGAHGTGTRAVKLLFKDRRLMATVMEQLKAQYVGATGRIGGVPNAYQLLFRVIDIKHRPGSGSVPGKLELVDAIVLPDTDGAWDLARRRATPHLRDRTKPDDEGTDAR